MVDNELYLNKKILVVFSDGTDHYSKKVGICTVKNQEELILFSYIIPDDKCSSYSDGAVSYVECRPECEIYEISHS